MAREGRYGWTPRQMERINARRAARGQEQLRNVNYEGSHGGGRMNRKEQPPKPIQDDEEEVSLAERQAERTKAFREKFKPTPSLTPQTSLASNKAMRDEEFNRRFGRKQTGVNPETVGGAYRKVIGSMA